MIKKYNLHIYFVIFISLFFHLFLQNKIAYCYNIYDIDRPYRKELNKHYKYNIDEESEIDNRININEITNTYIKNENAIYAEKKITEEKLNASKEENSEKRQKFLQQNSNNTTTTKIEKKEENQSWLDYWLPKINTKPFELIGGYTTIKLWMIYPMKTNISASETTRTATQTLFNGTTNFYIMPAVLISAGNDKFKYWRWEVELGYIPILSKISSNITSDVANTTFYPTTKAFSFHLLSCMFNNFAQYAFFDKRLVGFIGLGVGVGYAWSMDTKIMSSEFVLPIITGHLGISFLVGKKSKVNISYVLLYTQVKIPNKYGFERTNNNHAAILNGSLTFSNLIINAFSIEYQFYTS